MRRNTQRKLGPKGSAQKALGHARRLRIQLEQLADPDQKERFVDRFNDFLRSARTITEILGNESGHPAGLDGWVRLEHERLLVTDERYKLFNTLRNVSTKECLVEPREGKISLEVGAL